jgi:hypothetical protein
MAPKIKDSVLLGKTHKSIYFYTLTYGSFNYFQSLFYNDNTKFVPSNIQDLLTARGLAYWAMDDGSPERSGFILSTNSFKLVEVELLIQALENKFGLVCSVQSRIANGRLVHLIYIKSESWKLFKSLIEPYVIKHFAYKLQLRGS